MQTLCWCIEAILLITIASAPWAFGAVHPPFEFWVGVAIALVLVLWALRTVVEGRITWPVSRSSNWFSAGLFALFVIANVQTIALPQQLVDTLSPNTSATVQALIPQQRETVLATTSAAQQNEPQPVAKVARWSVGNKLSLNPGGSYLFSVRILSLAAIFIIVTSLPMPSQVLFRLSLAAAAIGTAFALFGIAQYFNTNKNQLYWFFETNTAGFAAYRNRNHYPFFANMALGLTIGLLLDRFQRRKRNGLAWLTQDTWVLWLGAASVFIVASIFLCASRGGFVAMAVALSIGLLPQLQAGQSLRTFATFSGLILSTALLLSWLSFDLFSSRLTMLADSTEMREEGRWHLWMSAIEGIWQFPLFGSGGDTFRYWETILNQNEAWSSHYSQGTRADNEFLDVFLEFGIVGCASLLIMAGAVFWQGYRLSRHSGLANGAFIAMIAVVVHSCFDFGLRVPASAVLATVIAALLCNLTASNKQAPVDARLAAMAALSNKPQPVTLSMRLSAVGFALACCLVGTLIVQDKLRQATAFNLQAQGMRALAADDFERCVTLMVQSTEVLPEDIDNQLQAVRIILRSLDATPDSAEREPRIATALTLSIQARDLCPLAFEPYFWLAEGFAQLRTSQTKLEYLANAHRLHPSESQISYQLGVKLAAASRYDEAWPVWRESVRFNASCMALILEQANQRLSAEEITKLVLPPIPERLFEAANLADRAGNSESAKVYLQRVLELLPIDGPNVHEQDAKEFAETCELVAKTNLRLNNVDAAIAAYQQAISFKPGATAWRQAFAQLLIKEERYDQAARELRTALVFEPDNEALKSLRDRVMRLQKESNKKK